MAMRSIFPIGVPTIRPRGRGWFFALSTIVAVTCGAFGQESRDHRIEDSFSAPLRYSGLGLSVRRPLPPTLPNTAPGRMDFSLFLRQSLTGVNLLSREPSLNGSAIQSFWKDELTRQNKYQTLTNILGVVEAGAVAYMAYEHLRRYGLK
jgi:hypothetical protein